MWEPRRLKNLWASTACYMDSFIFLPYFTYFLSSVHISICIVASPLHRHHQAHSNIRKSQHKRVSAAKHPAQSCFKYSLPFLPEGSPPCSLCIGISIACFRCRRRNLTPSLGHIRLTTRLTAFITPLEVTVRLCVTWFRAPLDSKRLSKCHHYYCRLFLQQSQNILSNIPMYSRPNGPHRPSGHCREEKHLVPVLGIATQIPRSFSR
jgi:hypothetical protein